MRVMTTPNQSKPDKDTDEVINTQRVPKEMKTENKVEEMIKMKDITREYVEADLRK